MQRAKTGLQYGPFLFPGHTSAGRRVACLMDIVLILLLILLNGVFAMSEIAVVSSRKSRLQNLADDGSLGAEAALRLHQEPVTSSI